LKRLSIEMEENFLRESSIMSTRSVSFLATMILCIFVSVLSVYGHEEKGLDVFSPVFIDLDGDAFNDIIGMFESRVRIYMNDGTGHFNDSSQRLGQSDVSSFVITKLYDTNTYYVLTGENERVSIYENDGTGTFGYSNEITHTYNTSHLAASDIDSDADVDIAIGHAAGAIIYENNGFLNFSSTANTFSISNPSAIYFSDVDADFDMDMIIDDVSSGTTILYNDGIGIFN